MKATKLYKKGDKFTVSAHRDASTYIAQRLGALGLVRGSEIEVINVAPLGDPIEIRSRGYNLSLRLSEMSELTLSPISH
jgi:ferrous iron transport protein A